MQCKLYLREKLLHRDVILESQNRFGGMKGGIKIEVGWDTG